MDGLQGARSSLQRIDEFLLKLQETAAGGGQPALPTAAPVGRGVPTAPFAEAFDSALDDDLNISAALGAVFEFIRDANKRPIAPDEAANILATWQQLDSILGFGIPAKSAVPAEVQALVEERQAARKAKNFKRSDEIRDQFKATGWVIEDTPQGPRAKRV
jgi:cysteinyl-tRNA synthetase